MGIEERHCRRRPGGRASALLGGLLAAVGVSPVAQAELVPTTAPALSVACDDLDLGPLVAALVSEINVLQKKSGPPLRFGSKQVTPLEYATRTLRPIYDLAVAGDKAKLCGALQYNFDWWKAAPKPILFTAYHTPVVRGSLTEDATYRYPLYRRPAGALAQLSTAQVLAGGLKGRGLELAWLADPYDALALHVEGAANVLLPDGGQLAIGTDGHNGQPYQNVSKLLVADNRLPGGPPPRTDKPGNPKARAYFESHPAELNVYWGRNPHYVFFKRTQKAGGGKLGALTPGRSVAIDESAVPMGALMWLSAQKPTFSDGKIVGWEPLQRIVLGQDTGAGIQGARIDVYFGEDAESLAAAQAMSVEGSAYVLLAR
jgi:membrane-bound lytic murein transglycosylase A